MFKVGDRISVVEAPGFGGVVVEANGMFIHCKMDCFEASHLFYDHELKLIETSAVEPLPLPG